MGFAYDTTGVKETETFAPLPPAAYNVLIQKIEEKDKMGNPLHSKNGDHMIKLRYVVENGEYEGRMIFDQVTFIKAGNPGAGMAKHFLHVLGEPFEGKLVVDPIHWLGKGLCVTVTIETYDDNGIAKQRNKVTDRAVYAIPF